MSVRCVYTRMYVYWRASTSICSRVYAAGLLRRASSPALRRRRAKDIGMFALRCFVEPTACTICLCMCARLLFKLQINYNNKHALNKYSFPQMYKMYKVDRCDKPRG